MGAGDFALWEDIADLIDPPVVRLVQASAQSLANNTPTALTYGAGSEEIDSHGLHDMVTNPSRITLGKAGIWEVRATLNLAVSSAVTIAYSVVAKNGANVQPLPRVKPAATSTTTGAQVAALVESDGDDYVEHMVVQVSGGSVSTQASSGVNSVFEAKFVRRPIS